MAVIHNHKQPVDEIFRPNCPRCKLNYAAPKLEIENKKLREANKHYVKVCNENAELKTVLELVYQAYRDKCIGTKYTVKQISKIHKLCKPFVRINDYASTESTS